MLCCTLAMHCAGFELPYMEENYARVHYHILYTFLHNIKVQHSLVSIRQSTGEPVFFY